MRTLVYNTIKNTPLVAERFEDRIYQRGTMGRGGVPENPKPPFIIFGEIPTVPHREVKDTSTAQTHYFQIYVMYPPGSFVAIDEVLQAIRDQMADLEEQVSPTGARCIGVDFRGFSQDFDDDRYDVSVRFGTWQITGSR